MFANELDANIASFDTFDIDAYAGLDKLEEAIGIIDNITNYGITKQDFDSLQNLFPELRAPEFELGAMPVRLGTQEIGNEVIAGLGTAATIAILTAFAAILGWIISKLFGDGSSSGGGGGSAAASISDLKAMGYPFSAELMTAVYEIQKAEATDGGAKQRITTKANTVKNVSIFIKDLNDGAIGNSFKLMAGITKELVKIVEMGADDKEVLKVLNGVFIKDFTSILSGNTAIASTAGTKLKMSAVTSIQAFNGAAGKLEGNDYSANLGTSEPKSFPKSIVLKDAGFANTNKAANAQKDALDKAVKDLKGKQTEISKDGYRAVSLALKVMLAYTKSTLLKQMVAGNKVITEYRDMLVGFVVQALKVYEGLSPIEKNMVDKEAGLEDGDVQELLEKVKKSDDKALKRSIEVFEAIAKTSKFKDDKEVSTVIDQMKKM